MLFVYQMKLYCSFVVIEDCGDTFYICGSMLFVYQMKLSYGARVKAKKRKLTINSVMIRDVPICAYGDARA